MEQHDALHQGLKPYYPVVWQLNRDAESSSHRGYLEHQNSSVAISNGELYQFSDGLDEIAFGAAVFWKSQNPNQAGPEWPFGMHPIPSGNFMSFLDTLAGDDGIQIA